MFSPLSALTDTPHSLRTRDFLREEPGRRKLTQRRLDFADEMVQKGVGEQFSVFSDSFFPIPDHTSTTPKPVLTANPFSDLECAAAMLEPDVTTKFVSTYRLACDDHYLILIHRARLTR